MLVYSLGMTLYWAVDFQLPQNQVVPQSPPPGLQIPHNYDENLLFFIMDFFALSQSS